VSNNTVAVPSLRSFAVWLDGAPAWAVQQLKERGIADETSGLDGVPF